MLLIKNGTIRTIAGEIIKNGDILCDGTKIAAIGQNLSAPTDAQVIDAAGCLVTPGFVDAHTHIGLHEEAVRWEGQDYNEMSDPVTPAMRAIDAINPMDEAFDVAVRGGVTTAITGPGSANVIGGTFSAIKLHGKRVDDMVIKKEVAMKVAFGENPKGCYGQSGRKEPNTRMAVAALLREMLAKAKRYADEIDEAEKDETKKRPFDFDLEAMLPVIRGEMPIKVHAHRADDMFTAIRIIREFGIKATLDHVTEGHLIADELAAEGFPVFVGPSLGSKSKFELKNKTFETAGILAKKGLTVSIITDAPVIPLCHLPLCAGLAIKAGMDEEDAWKAITINPAKSVGIDNRVGSLEVGKDADIAIFCGNPLRDIQCETKCMVINGEVVYQA